MKKTFIFALLFFSLILILSACNKKSNKTSSDSNVYNNDIFTEDLYNSIVEIDFLYGGKEININNNDDLYSMYSQFASLILTEAPDNKEPKDGHQIIKMVTKDKTIEIGLLSNEIIVDNTKYTVDKDIVIETRNIALKNRKKE
ncbi:MAG TPA: hypothetical protein DEG06_00070 [Lachnospiraceae bacterium]|jgi:hypothetical protein|nr:hypothetical protein [Lachnospiraceae bacterium]HBY70617.1 hypothetical protein [Lachnospiraceae bacterium]HCA70570.1 hypothetical protein [Lachnospiraceae bacterium]HCM13564.1 hypothetical protein [Lachnospiraceae bacterium]